MIKKILAVKDFRVFKNWTAEAGSSDFERVNLVYGINGSGKSTLATLLARASADAAWGTGLRLTAVAANGDVVSVRTADDALWRNVKVFNRDYVAANLRFDAEGQSRTKPLLILGQKQIDREEKIQVAEKRRTRIVGDLPTVQASARRASRLAEDLATGTATQLAENCRPLVVATPPAATTPAR